MDQQRPVPLNLYEAYWVSGRASGTVHVWAPDARTAVRTVREHASCFGLPHENPVVGRAIPLATVETPLSDAA